MESYSEKRSREWLMRILPDVGDSYGPGIHRKEYHAGLKPIFDLISLYRADDICRRTPLLNNLVWKSTLAEVRKICCNQIIEHGFKVTLRKDEDLEESGFPYSYSVDATLAGEDLGAFWGEYPVFIWVSEEGYKNWTKLKPIIRKMMVTYVQWMCGLLSSSVAKKRHDNLEVKFRELNPGNPEKEDD